MKQPRLDGPRPGWVARVLGAVTGMLVLAGLFLAGLIAWVLFAGVVLVGGLALSIWYWRARRRFDKLRREAGARVIEVEYEVLHEEETRR